MLTILIAIGCVTAVLGLAAFLAMCLGIRHDDRAARLDGPPPGPAAWLARRFTGLKTNGSSAYGARIAAPRNGAGEKAKVRR